MKTALELQQRLLAFIHGASDDFNALAREVFAFQFERNTVFRAFCEQKQQTPDRVRHWTEIPATPTHAFKQFVLTSFPPEQAVAEFHTSGTTLGQPGRHLFQTLELYKAACVRSFHEHLFSDGAQMPLLSLVPEHPHSSLAYMMSALGARFINRPEPTSEPVCLLGTAFHFLNLFDAGLQLQLPPGSRVMETGGFKGRSREVSKTELYKMFEKHLGIPDTHIVNEYGMTELSTQFYDETMRQGRRSDLKRCPPWARVRVIDPQTDEDAPAGAPGLLRIYDLANLGSVLCIQTEDLGYLQDDGFVLMGRAPGAVPRGCSLIAESQLTP